MWVVQNNLFREAALKELIFLFEDRGLEYREVKIVPFTGMIEPDIEVKNPVIAFGTTTMIEVARRKNWIPGVFHNKNFDFTVWGSAYSGYLLNENAQVMKFKNVYFRNGESIFIRPCDDTKIFSGELVDEEHFDKWQEKVYRYGSSLKPETPVLIAPPKKILREYRFFIVDGEPVTGSQYKEGERNIEMPYDDGKVFDFVKRIIQIWQPADAFVLDIAETTQGFKVIEINCINCSGFYGCRVEKLVDAMMKVMEYYSLRLNLIKGHSSTG